MRRFNPLPLIGAAVFVLALGPAQMLHAQGCTNVFTHNSLPPGEIPTGANPDESPTFIDQGIALSFGVYQGPNGPQYGTALAESASAEFGFTQVLALNDISAVYSLSQALPAGTSVQQVVVYFQDLNPGPEEIQVNDASPVFWNITDLMAAPNLPLAPGIEVAIDMEPGSTTVGKLILTGNVGSLKLGGMDLKLDDVCINPNEDPNGGGGTAGCTYEVALNFNPNATVDDGSCQFDFGGNPCANDSDGDGVCDEDEVPGCTGPCSCNYNPEATDDDGSCVESDALGVCGGFCPADLDGDGECDDEDCCVGGYDECGVCNGPGAIYDCGCDVIPPGACDCQGNVADALGNCGGDCPSDADGDGICDLVDDCVGMVDVCGVCNGPGPIFDCGCVPLSPGACDCEGNQLDALGICGGNCPGDTDGDGICDTEEIPGCMQANACNYNPQATDDSGDCFYAAPGYDCQGECIIDTDADGICDDSEIPGCMESEACNFNPDATDNVGCFYPLPSFNCAGECLEDLDGDGICDGIEIPGCTDGAACNYLADATEENGSCQFPPIGFDCNGDCLEDADGDGICDGLELVGCTDDDACNFNPDAQENDGTCLYPPLGFDCNGQCLNDTDGDGICDLFELPGCMDPSACNYNPQATQPDDSCEPPLPGYTCDGICLDFDGDGVCDVDEVSGCTYGGASNYNEVATEDDGSCEFPPTGSSGCPDLDGDGQVAVGDLLILLGQFGSQIDC